MQDKEEEEEEESNDNIDEKYKAYEDGADFAKRKYTPWTYFIWSKSKCYKNYKKFDNKF